MKILYLVMRVANIQKIQTAIHQRLSNVKPSGVLKLLLVKMIEKLISQHVCPVAMETVFVETTVIKNIPMIPKIGT
jgi:hypothetical protein